jgi:hypothetical protein
MLRTVAADRIVVISKIFLFQMERRSPDVPAIHKCALS